MTAKVLPLYPECGPARPVEGLYLEHRLHEIGSARSPFVYGSFVSSLDGRIAVMDAGSAEADVMQGLTNQNDFRLFQELHAQADCLITHGGYLRALAQGRLGNVLQVNATGQAGDLAEWRKQNGLAAQPAILIASGSLDFPIHPSISDHGQPVYIATGAESDPERVQALRERGFRLIVAGEGAMVEGAPLVRALGELGYRCLYLLAGPKMLEAMLRDHQLSRLYLTMRHRLLGGERFHTLIDGPRLGELGQLTLRRLYQDRGDDRADGQWFAQFDRLQPNQQPTRVEGTK
jgi:riboflavin biosynthesis pyrimidine reductase